MTIEGWREDDGIKRSIPKRSNPRPSKDHTWMEVALALSKQSTCLRRNVGCVLLDSLGHVLSTGWNGVASKQPHCNDPQVVFDGSMPSSPSGIVARGSVGTLYEGVPTSRGILTHTEYLNACPGAQATSGTRLDACQAIHAEQNALLQCPNVYAIATVYCTASPCMTCTKLLIGTSAARLVFYEDYPAPGAKELWEAVRGAGTWIQLNATKG